MITKIEYILIKDLKLYKNNAKLHSAEQINKIAQSIREYGFINPVLIDKENVVIAGHGRIEGAKVVGMDKVPCIRVEHLTPEQIRAYRIIDNRLVELGEWDMELLTEELEFLKDTGNYNLDFLDFDLDTVKTEIRQVEDDTGFKQNLEIIREKSAGKYVQSAEGIQYISQSENPPDIKDLYNREKTLLLIEKIKQAEISDPQLRSFLMQTAFRFTDFNFRNIAEYYSHLTDQKVKDLFKDLALVIIDLNDAIQRGWIRIEKQIIEEFQKEYKEGEDEE